MNYCQSCRRHLNGAVSCPGCGAIGVAVPETQDSHSTDWMTEVAWPERDPLPAVESRSAAGIGERADGDSSNVRAGTRSAAPTEDSAVPAAELGAEPAHATLAHARGSAADFPTGRRVRRSRKRNRGLGLKATVTGGFAGIAVIGLLVLGNLPSAGGAAPTGAVAAVATTAPQSPGGTSSSSASTQTLTNGGPATGSGSKSTASSNASSTSPSPGSSSTPGPTATSTVSATSATSATAAQGEQSSGPSTVSSSAQSSSPATQSTTPSPSPSKTQVSCILIICW